MNDHDTNSQTTYTGPLPEPEPLGARIRSFRTQQGLSQEALAEKLDVSRQAVAKWERGASLPSTANLLALSRIFGCSVSELSGTPQEAEHAPAGQTESTGQAPLAEPRKSRPRLAVFAGVIVLVLAAVVCLEAAVGTLLTCLITPAATLGVIGGADGPTSILVTGPDIPGIVFCIAALLLGIGFVICAVLLWRRHR